MRPKHSAPPALNVRMWARSGWRLRRILTSSKYARAAGRTVVTLDADFHTILVVSGMSAPSVIRIRLEGLNGPAIATIIREVLTSYAPDLAVGCMITVKEQRQPVTCCGPPTECRSRRRSRIGRKLNRPRQVFTQRSPNSPLRSNNLHAGCLSTRNGAPPTCGRFRVDRQPSIHTISTRF